MIELQIIKSNKGCYIKQPKALYYHLSNLIFNGGDRVKDTFNKEWFYLPAIPEKIQYLQPELKTTKGFTLINKALATEFKEFYSIDEAYDNTDSGYDYKFEKIRGLYEEVFEVTPKQLIDIDFKISIVAEIEEELEKPSFSYKTIPSYDRYYKDSSVTEKDVTYNPISTILTPDILLHKTPCYLTSEQMYRIVRAFIKEHLNPKVAVITSDYDFCFTVKKRVTLTESYSYVRNEILFGKTRRKPKKETVYVTNRDVEIFEMTYSPKNYEKYTPIAELHGESLEDLSNKLDKYLAELINFINEPVRDCENCKGCGVIFERTL